MGRFAPLVRASIEPLDQLKNLGGVALGRHVVEGVPDYAFLVDHDGRPNDAKFLVSILFAVLADTELAAYLTVLI